VYIERKTKDAKGVKWQDFYDAFIKEFGSAKLKEEAEAELEIIQQGTMTIQDFTQKFRDLVRRSGIKEEIVLKRYLKRGVKPALRERLALTYPQPETTEEMIE
jgi:hypothetical protein